MIRTQDIEAASEDPAALEALYRSAQSEGQEAAFKEALLACQSAHPDDVLLAAWAYRFDLPIGPADAERGRDANWWIVVAASVLLGVVSALLARGKPPVPIADEADVLFRVGWGPLVAIGLLCYLAWVQRSAHRLSRYAAAAVAVFAASVYVGLAIGEMPEDAAFLASTHLLFVSWASVGAALCVSFPNPARQAYAYMVKSVEAVLTGGIFFGAGLIFVGLTYGIFAVLGIELPEEDLVVVAAWGVGTIPLLAIGSVYDAESSPLRQDWHAGLTRTLRILAQLMLPLALGVLLVYVLWFIPVYFQKPFEERDVLIVYNASILAIMMLLTVVVSGPMESGSVRRRNLFRFAVLGLGALTLILNVYALAAVAGRTIDMGLTPNRFAVMGWNVTTLLILTGTGLRIWKRRSEPWIAVLQESTGLLAPIAAVWGLVLLITLPFLSGVGS